MKKPKETKKMEATKIEFNADDLKKLNGMVTEEKSEYASKLRQVISGKLLKAIVKCFCQRPHKGDQAIAASIGIAPEGFIATTGKSAIVIGPRSESYDATQRNEALLEAERAMLYEKTVELDDIARMLDSQGDIEAFGLDVGSLVAQLAGFRSVGHMRPEVLKTIAVVAEAAGASSVELLEPRDGEAERLGFRFTFEPEDMQFELGEEPPELPVTAEGLVYATRKIREESVEAEQDDTE